MERMSVEVARGALPPARRAGCGTLFVSSLALALVGIGLVTQGRPGFVAWQLARDHKRGLAERPGERVWSSEPRVVGEWLERHGTELPPLPARAGSASLVGARYCALVDRVAAHVLYEAEETSVSIFVVTGPLRAPRAWSGRSAGLHLRLLRSGGRTLAFVGESEDDVAAAARAFATSVAELAACPGRC